MTKDVFIKEIRQSETMLYHVAKSILKNDSDCGEAVHFGNDYYGAEELPVRCGVSHLSGLTEPLH